MATKRERAVIGAFESATEAKRAIKDLRDAGFSDRCIGVLTHGREGDAEIVSLRELEGNKAATGAAVGVAAGAGGGALWVLAIAAGFLPPIGPIVGGGLLAALAAGAAGAGIGAVVGTLVGLGVTDEEAAYYAEELRKGRTILVIQDEERHALIETILRGHGARARDVVAPTIAEQANATSR